MTRPRRDVNAEPGPKVRATRMSNAEVLARAAGRKLSGGLAGNVARELRRTRSGRDAEFTRRD